MGDDEDCGQHIRARGVTRQLGIMDELAYPALYAMPTRCIILRKRHHIKKSEMTSHSTENTCIMLPILPPAADQ